MICKHCGKAIELIGHCDEYFAEEDGVRGYTCTDSRDGDHEPEDAQ